MKKFDLRVLFCVCFIGVVFVSCSTSSGNQDVKGDTQGAKDTQVPQDTQVQDVQTDTQGTQSIFGVVSNNHGHIAELTGAQLDAGLAVDLDIRGTATHTHTVSLSADDITSIKAGTQVARQSSVTLSHSHLVTFN